MQEKKINGENFIEMLLNGAKNLAHDVERINALNVFPVPDGDTGTNMQMTVEGAFKVADNCPMHLGEATKLIARSMVLSARGNSGVILSQFFKGLAMSLEQYESVDVNGFANAMVGGAQRSYSVVTNPTEGTILTVMREAGENALTKVSADMSFKDYLSIYLDEANKALEKTPELLPVLKKAGVIDSGGAGFILIIEGLLKTILGEEVEGEISESKSSSLNVSNFNADSELTYGYCTEFILQLQNKKVNPKTFDIKVIIDYLETIGDSIVAFKDDDIVKIHVHTFEPGDVLKECRKYGEFLTLKIENMNVGHSETEFVNEIPKKEHKKNAIVCVANGEGLTNSFYEMGVDIVVGGGQTMNSSTEDFIKAFQSIDADNIFVYPNNRNILLAAKLAAENYQDANVIVIPTDSIAAGYSAISLLDIENMDIQEIIDTSQEAIENITTLEVTYSVRDAEIDNVKVQKDEFICISDHHLIASNKNRYDAVCEAINKIDLSDKSVFTIIYGDDVSEEELDKYQTFINKDNPYIEVYRIYGGQEIYSLIIGIE